jgi:hypothetical protein
VWFRDDDEECREASRRHSCHGEEVVRRAIGYWPRAWVAIAMEFTEC